jgi:hypothetical protein
VHFHGLGSLASGVGTPTCGQGTGPLGTLPTHAARRASPRSLKKSSIPVGDANVVVLLRPIRRASGARYAAGHSGADWLHETRGYAKTTGDLAAIAQRLRP